MNTVNEEAKKNELLKELANLGYHSSGRKQRSDKDQIRGEIKSTDKSKLWTYIKIKNQLYNRDQKLREREGYGLFLEMDENSFYLLIPARYRNEGKMYTQTYKGRKIEHIVRRTKIQNEIDLEQYRFNGYKEQAVLHGQEIVPEKYWPEVRQMLNIRYGLTGDEATQALTKRQITWIELFCEFYFLSKDEYWLWEYEHWQRDYSYIPTQQLPEDFEFLLNYPPGSEEFHPEWAYKRKEREEQIKSDEEQEKKRKGEQFIINIKRRKM